MFENKKRDHHYVFQAYLKKWTNANEKLWCLRDDKVFEVKTNNIAFEKDFYRLYPLTDKEIEFIKLFFSKASDAFKKEMNHFFELYTTIDRNEKFLEVIDNLYSTKVPGICETIADINCMIDVARNNIMEDFYCDLEGEACVWINNLCEENVDFLYSSSNEQKEKFARCKMKLNY